MFDFGLEGYRPRWLNGRAAVTAAQGPRLRSLVGRPLSGVRLVWDLQDDEWFCDCPVLLDFDGEQVELNHSRLDDLSITWNSIDPRGPVRWDGFDLRWRRDERSEAHALQGQLLQDVELLTWAGRRPVRRSRDPDLGTVDVHFRFPRGGLTVLNALDENGLAFGPPAPTYRRHPLR
ncbi:hypothetical protein DFP74_1722 [Nocardiopsis sp. Huas11]|uniref:hypothetical protein n=1 Tax=Nocardiopsis sp. Huas11 TaxID=2183912 RepID=UPI000EAC8B4C|nr:hypothetical protein [Nocardiopsis sp. Huas11]RKS06099.1 hypothetical protein DFP74_1722 [Nocardiopsis sp. Huas11]